MNETTKTYTDEVIAEPFKHDCDKCTWVSWLHIGQFAFNVYHCKSRDGGSIVLRYGDKGYQTISLPYPIQRDPGNCGYGDGVEIPLNIKFRGQDKPGTLP